MFDTLRRRVSFFLGDPREGRRGVRELVGELEEFGEVAIVGGMLRDMLTGDYASFTSDVDLVVDTNDTSAAEAHLLARGARRNRFGGYALDRAWKVDVWMLNRTWAHVEGHREVKRLGDVAATTFFNWDAILYSTRTRRFLCSNDYLEQLRARYLDLNLLPNPNPTGNLVRTLRAAVRQNATLSPALASFACEQLAQVGTEAVVEAERRSYGRQAAALDPESVCHAGRVLRYAALHGREARPFPPSAVMFEDLPAAPPGRQIVRSNPPRRQPCRRDERAQSTLPL